MKPFDVINLGSGKGYSVMEVVDTYGRVAGKEVKYVIGQRREGDAAYKVAVTQKASHLLHWTTTKNLEDMCRDSYNYVTNNQ